MSKDVSRLAQDILHDFEIREKVDLCPYTRIGVGGPADYLTVVRDTSRLAELYKLCAAHKVRFLPLGHGSNVFFPDEGYHGLVAIMAMDGMELVDDITIEAQAGAPLSEVNRLCICSSLTGFEFSSGIPGTVGGAVYGNAGAYGNNIGECVTGATVMLPDGSVKEVGPSFFKFDYRHSALKTNGAVLLSVRMTLQPGDYQAILQRVREIRAIRAKKLPHWSAKTAGSWFKNIPNPDGHNIAAARYLDEIGSKQTAVGDAGIHPKHANIVFNKGNATAGDLIELDKVLRTRVKEKFNIELQREVMFLQ